MPPTAAINQIQNNIQITIRFQNTPIVLAVGIPIVLGVGAPIKGIYGIGIMSLDNESIVC